MNLRPKYIFSYINEINDGKIFEKALNKSIKSGMILPTSEPDVMIFNSKFNQPHEFIVIKRQLKLEKELIINLTNLILNQLELSKLIPTKTGLEKGNYNERKKGNIESIINSLVCYKWFNEKDKISVLDMAADIMYRIAVANHPFSNGNKRTALLSVGAFLDMIGLYFYFYKIKSKKVYLEKWENFMIEIARSKQEGKTELETLKKIKEKLFNSIWMNFQNNIFWSSKLINNNIMEAQDEEIWL